MAIGVGVRSRYRHGHAGISSVLGGGGGGEIVFLRHAGTHVNLNGEEDTIKIPSFDATGGPLGDGNMPSAAAARTFEMWLRLTSESVGADVNALSTGVGGNYHDYTMVRRVSDNLLANHWFLDKTFTDADADFWLQFVGEWHHFAVVYEGSGGDEIFYVDGVADLSWTPSPDLGTTRTDLWLLGGSEGHINQGQRLAADIFDFRIWNVARSPAQLLAGKDAFPEEDATGLAAAYNMQEGEGTSLAGYGAGFDSTGGLEASAGVIDNTNGQISWESGTDPR